LRNNGVVWSHWSKACSSHEDWPGPWRESGRAAGGRVVSIFSPLAGGEPELMRRAHIKQAVAYSRPSQLCPEVDQAGPKPRQTADHGRLPQCLDSFGSPWSLFNWVEQCNLGIESPDFIKTYVPVPYWKTLGNLYISAPTTLVIKRRNWT